MRTTEILAPVGGQEQLLAAVRCGADAVYLGAKGFNARRNAENFESTTLEGAVQYCHARNVKVYVTVNTLVTDEELPQLVETLHEIAQAGADAMIVQDMAVAALARVHCPGIELHASTQMTVHNAEGARLLEGLGFTRVVLARELTLDEIRSIHAQTSLELEVFVHGALCMSVSGACYLSSMLGGRSGNRGLCAQPCRLDFRTDSRSYALSLKDLSAIGMVDALMEAGVSALKIEGRMKRPEYVAAAVTACRQALAKEPYDLAALEAVFSRGGFTDGYLASKRNLSMFGVRGHEDVQASQRVQGQLAGLYRHERPAVPVDMTLTLAADMPSSLCVTDGVHAVEATGDIPQTAQMAPTDEPRARRSLSKTGESPFALRMLTLHTDGTLMLPASVLNAMRRNALSSLLSLREAPQPKAFVDAPLPQFPPHVAAENPTLHLRLQSAQQLWDGMDAARIMLPVEEITPKLLAQYEGRLVGELPALLFPAYSDRIDGLLGRLKEAGLAGVLCHNIGSIEMARGHGMTIHGGYGLNILNTAALTAYAGLGLADATVSFELSAQKLRRLGGTMARGAIAYGYLPLMQLRCCPAQQAGDCGTCDGHPTLTDRKGIRFPLLCERKRYVTLLNSVPLNLSGEPLPGVDFHTLYFTNETAAECRRITDDFINHTPPTGERTRGLYFRTLQ